MTGEVSTPQHVCATKEAAEKAPPKCLSAWAVHSTSAAWQASAEVAALLGLPASQAGDSAAAANVPYLLQPYRSEAEGHTGPVKVVQALVTRHLRMPHGLRTSVGPTVPPGCQAALEGVAPASQALVLLEQHLLVLVKAEAPWTAQSPRLPNPALLQQLPTECRSSSIWQVRRQTLPCCEAQAKLLRRRDTKTWQKDLDTSTPDNLSLTTS